MNGKILTRAEILARKTGHGIVTLEDGASVKVRGLTRGEAADMRAFEEEHPGDLIGLEALAISKGMTEPQLTHEDARAWLVAEGHGYVQRVVSGIQDLSGQAPGQAKEYLKRVPRRG
jgi:hypothetical protein